MRKRKESPKGGDGGRGRKKRGGSYRSYRFIFEPDGGRGCSLKCSGELRGKREHFERLYGKKGIEHEKDDDEESDGRIVEGAGGLLQDERFQRTVCRESSLDKSGFPPPHVACGCTWRGGRRKKEHKKLTQTRKQCAPRTVCI
jgi:hypothetical protein